MTMKAIFGTQIFAMVLFLFGVSFSSCEKIESIADVKFDASFVGDFLITIQDCEYIGEGRIAGDGCSFSETIYITLRSDPDIDKYYSNLKDFDVLEVTGKVTSITGGPVIINGTLSISAGTTTASWIIENFKMESGAVFTLDNSNGQWDKLNKILDGKRDFSISIDGTADKENVSFVLRVTVKTRVTANPL